MADGGSGTPLTLWFNGRKVREATGGNWDTRGDWRPIVFGRDTWWHGSAHPACRMKIDEVKICAAQQCLVPRLVPIDSLMECCAAFLQMTTP